nr:hypothetical protein [Salinicola tamaricis]
MPDAASREAAAMVENPNTCLIDASTAFRTADDWVYGLPELAPASASGFAPASASPTSAATPAPSCCWCGR